MAAAKVVSLKMTEPPSSSGSGANSISHVVNYECRVNQLLTSAHVEQLAQELIGTLPSSGPNGEPIHEVPNPGDRFLFFGGQVRPDEAAPGVPYADDLSDFFVAAGDNTDTFYDQGSLALDFETTRLPGGCPEEWAIRVTYRAPNATLNEQPQQLIPIIAGRNGVAKSPINIKFTNGKVSGATQRWVEQRQSVIETNIGYRVRGDGAVSEKAQPMVMTNGEEFPPVETTRLAEVLVISEVVENEDYAKRLNKGYHRTLNIDPFPFGSRKIDARTAYYETTKTSKPIQRNNTTYYRAETRIVVYPEANYITRQSRGSYEIDATGQKQAIFDNEGNKLTEAPLNEQGQQTTITVLPDPFGGTFTIQQDAALVTHSLERPTSYSVFQFSRE